MTTIKILTLLFSLLFNFSFLSAGVFVSADHSYIQYFGRWNRENPTAPTHSWPGVYIKIKFSGTRISVKLNDNFCYYNVFLDGNLHSVFHNSEYGDVTKLLAEGLPDTTHTLIFSKRNETSWTKFTFLGFELDDGETLLPPDPKPELKIEFIGDSFTSASGNEAPGSNAPEQVEFFTNIDLGFGPIVARNYGAQYHMTSLSGIGLVLDWQGNHSFNMPDYFDRTLAYTPEPKWDFEQWVPNLVIIGLGLNDYSGYGGWQNGIIESETAEYIHAYHEFISTIRNDYPGIKILAVAPHVDWIRECVKQVVTTERDDGYNDLYYAQYSQYPGGYVNEGHPNVETHRKIADEIIAAIDTIDAFTAYLDTLPPVFEKIPETPFIAYEKEVQIQLSTDSYSTVKYSLSEKPWKDMEYRFDETGKREHKTIFSGEHGQEYQLFIKAADINGNEMQQSLLLKFTIDTTKVLLNWYHQNYDDSQWATGPAGFGFGTTKTTATEPEISRTVYFRKNFLLEDKESLLGLGFLIQGIGGSVVYLNGREIARLNLPDDTAINYETESTDDGYFQKVITIDGNNGFNDVFNGENNLAVEIHAVQENFSELFFNAQLFNNKNQLIFPLNSVWSYYSSQQRPDNQLVDRTSLNIERDQNQVALDFDLQQNFPNPFNNSTIIKYTLKCNAKIIIDIVDLQGRLVENLVDNYKQAGSFEYHYTGTVPSGLYFCRLTCHGRSIQRKMVLLK
ncbi:MAG: T9SS type A sorting domain-containing protein [Candidatus Marinimicrobia bacterium]|nr:T9SS type A sorting domain-containing protein [Candidatus Neomarinimicrobiota bacterium]